MGEMLILGIGNVLLRDEGVGVRVVEWLIVNVAELPPDTRIVDGGTLGLELLPQLTEAGAIVLVDAVASGDPPGTVRTLRGSALETAVGHHLSPHQLGIADLLAVARLTGALPDRCALVGIQPGNIEVGLELSDPVRRSVPVAARRVCAEAWNLQTEEETTCTRQALPG